MPACTTGAMPCWALEQDGRCPSLRDPASGDLEKQRLVVRGVDATASIHATCHVYKP